MRYIYTDGIFKMWLLLQGHLLYIIYNEYIPRQYELNKLEGRMSAFEYKRVCHSFVDIVIYIISLMKQFTYPVFSYQ